MTDFISLYKYTRCKEKYCKLTMADRGNISQLYYSYTLSSGEMPGNVFQISLTLLVSLSLVVNICGVTGNILIIIVYSKMGFSDSTNISLVALAISDIGSVLPTACGCVLTLFSLYEQLPVSLQVVRLVSTWPHIAMTRVTTFITCFISLERCLCVMIPLKIKRIITARRTVFILVLIYVAILPPVSMIYFKWTLSWKFFASQNKTLLGQVVIKDNPLINAITTEGDIYYCSFLPIATCTFVTVCTVYLTTSLRRSKKWRDTITSSAASGDDKTRQDVNRSTKSGASSSISKEERTVRIVIAVAVTFVASMLIHISTILARHVESEWSGAGRYSKYFRIVWTIADLSENINASINVIIYYKMSSKFRENFLILLNKHKQ